jgi:hypothetical protein
MSARRGGLPSRRATQIPLINSGITAEFPSLGKFPDIPRFIREFDARIWAPNFPDKQGIIRENPFAGFVLRIALISRELSGRGMYAVPPPKCLRARRSSDKRGAKSRIPSPAIASRRAAVLLRCCAATEDWPPNPPKPWRRRAGYLSRGVVDSQCQRAIPKMGRV